MENVCNLMPLFKKWYQLNKPHSIYRPEDIKLSLILRCFGYKKGGLSEQEFQKMAMLTEKYKTKPGVRRSPDYTLGTHPIFWDDIAKILKIEEPPPPVSLGTDWEQCAWDTGLVKKPREKRRKKDADRTTNSNSEGLPHEGGRTINVSHAGPGSDSHEPSDTSGPKVCAVLEPEQPEQPELFTAKPLEPEVVSEKVDNNHESVDKEFEEIDKEEMAALISPNMDGWVPAKRLHEFLKVETEYRHWVKRRLDQYGFVQDEDFLRSKTTALPSYLSIDTAKQLCMVEKGERGRAARRYYIECERVAKDKNNALTSDPAIQLEILKTLKELRSGNNATEAKVSETQAVAEQAQKDIQVSTLTLPAMREIEFSADCIAREYGSWRYKHHIQSCIKRMFVGMARNNCTWRDAPNDALDEIKEFLDAYRLNPDPQGDSMALRDWREYWNKSKTGRMVKENSDMWRNFIARFPECREWALKNIDDIPAIEQKNDE